MALVLSPWFGIGCTRRSNSRSNCPTLFTDLVVVEVPLQKQAWAPVISPSPHNTSAMRWDDTAEAHIFKFACKVCKKISVSEPLSLHPYLGQELDSLNCCTLRHKLGVVCSHYYPCVRIVWHPIKSCTCLKKEDLNVQVEDRTPQIG